MYMTIPHENRTQSNPDYRIPNDGELCGGGFDDKGLYQLHYDAANQCLRKDYADGHTEAYLFATEPLNRHANWNGIIFKRDSTSRHFKLLDDGSLVEVNKVS